MDIASALMMLAGASAGPSTPVEVAGTTLPDAAEAVSDAQLSREYPEDTIIVDMPEIKQFRGRRKRRRRKASY